MFAYVLSKTKRLEIVGQSFPLLCKVPCLLWLMIMVRRRMVYIKLHSPCKLRKSTATDADNGSLKHSYMYKCSEGRHHPKYTSLSMCQVTVFVFHTLKIITLSRRDTACITLKSLGTVPPKGQETALGLHHELDRTMCLGSSAEDGSGALAALNNFTY